MNISDATDFVSYLWGDWSDPREIDISSELFGFRAVVRSHQRLRSEIVQSGWRLAALD